MKKYIFMFLLIGTVGYSQETGTLRGHVFNQITNEPLAMANVVLAGQVIGAATDNNGNFEIKDIPAGEYNIKVSYVGYQDFKKTILVQKNQIIRLDVPLKEKAIAAQAIVVSAIRAKEGLTPVAFTNLNSKEIDEKNFGQEIPLLLNEVPGVYSYSQTGSSLGYSEVKIRGFDPTRIAVTINNVPLNDPEDHVTYFYDIPDLSANVEDIQVQRGVGNSLYGGAAIGGSVSILTQTYKTDPAISFTSGFGSYNTRRLNFSYNSGMVSDQYSFNARFSKINSDGYRDDAWVKAWSYFLSATRYDDRMVTTFNTFGGPIRAHFAWFGIDKNTLQTNRKLNYDSPQFNNGHKDNVDDFLQAHYQLINNFQISPAAVLQNTFFHVKGDGYFETYKFNRKFSEYNLPIIIFPDTLNRTNLVRQKLVSKSQWGWLPRFSLEHKNGVLVLGGQVDLYSSNHHGEIKWAEILPPDIPPGHKYYEYNTKKNLFTIYAHEAYNLSAKINLMMDLQFQHLKYEFNQERIGAYANKGYSYKLNYNFITPRFGLNYKLNESLNVFGNFSMAKREPKDSDIYDADDPAAFPAFKRIGNNIDFNNPTIQPETLYDYELGFGCKLYPFEFKMNAYLMDFHNEIVPTGRVDEDGLIVFGNAERSLHRGIEVSAKMNSDLGLTLLGNASISDNIFIKYIEPAYDADWNVVYKDRKNNVIAGFPSLIVNARINYQWNDFTASMQFQSVGKQYLDNSNDEELSIDPYNVFNVMLRYTLSGIFTTKKVTVDFRINNFFNELYETHGAVDAGVGYYIPAAERNYILTLGLEI